MTNDRRDVSGGESPPTRRRIFREAAIEAHRQGARPGRPLHISAAWTRWATRLVVGALVAAVTFAATARVGEYAEAAAVVRREGRLVVTSMVAGAVRSVEVATGQRVTAGQLLARLDDAAEQAELERAQREYEQRLVALLRRPAQSELRERLAAVDVRLQLAQTHVRQRQIIAPCDGIITDTRVQLGEPVAPGDPAFSIERDDARTVVVGLFPGRYRPLLDADEARFYLEVEGYPDSRYEVALRSLADEVIGPEEAMRHLGRGNQGALELAGEVVVVTVDAPDAFIADGVEYRLFEGMQGTLESKVRAETVLEALVPALKKL